MRWGDSVSFHRKGLGQNSGLAMHWPLSPYRDLFDPGCPQSTRETVTPCGRLTGPTRTRARARAGTRRVLVFVLYHTPLGMNLTPLSQTSGKSGFSRVFSGPDLNFQFVPSIHRRVEINQFGGCSSARVASRLQRATRGRGEWGPGSHSGRGLLGCFD